MNASENPFSADRIHAIAYRPSGWDWDELLARAKSLAYRCAIVGPQGSGKSTLLRELANRLGNRGLRAHFIGLTRERRKFEPGVLDRLFSSIGPRDLICFDGSEQMSALAWHRFRLRSRVAGGLLLTTHSPGRMPTLVKCETDVSLLTHLVRTLEPMTVENEESLATLFTRHQGNIRDALRELYDRRAGIEL